MTHRNDTTTPPRRATPITSNFWTPEKGKELRDQLQAKITCAQIEINQALGSPLTQENAAMVIRNKIDILTLEGDLKSEKRKIDTWYTLDVFNKGELDGLKRGFLERKGGTKESLKWELDDHISENYRLYKKYYELGSSFGFEMRGFMTPQSMEDKFFPMPHINLGLTFPPCPECGGKMEHVACNVHIRHDRIEIYPECVNSCVLTYEQEKTLGFYIEHQELTD